MNARMHAILESKRQERRRLAAMPFHEKLRMLERLRDRAVAIADSPLHRERGSRADKAWILARNTE